METTPSAPAPATPTATQPARPVEVNHPPMTPPSVLDRGIDLTAVSGWALAWMAVLATAAAFRLTGLNLWALAPSEARWAFDGYALFRGLTLGPGESLPTTAPLLLLLQSLSFFLFGATDATARLPSAILGLAMLPLIALLRPFVGRAAVFGMAALVAISPTLVYASRLVESGILISFSVVLLIVAFLRSGLSRNAVSSVRRWAVFVGVSLGMLLASGPAAITVLLGVLVGFVAAMGRSREATANAKVAETPARSGPVKGANRGDGRQAVGPHDTTKTQLAVVSRPSAVQAASRAIVRTPGALLGLVVGFVATILLLFTRFFSDLGALVGIGVTFADWGRLLTTTASATPTQYFLLAVLLYEFLAVFFAIVATNDDPLRMGDADAGTLNWTFFASWAATVLLLFAFSSGRQPEHVVHVALPVVLLGGIGFGNLIARLNWRDILQGSSGLLFLTMLGLVVGLAAVGILGSRAGTAVVNDRTPLVVQIVVVAIVVVGGLVYAATALIQNQRADGNPRQVGGIALLVVAVLFGAVTVRTTTGLTFYNVASGHELIAQGTSTQAVNSLANRLRLLSRDVSVDRGSIRDPIGAYSLQVTIDRRVEWPYRWYFRDFVDVQVVTAGQAPATGAETILVPDEVGLAEAGYTPRQYAHINRVPPAFASPDMGAVLLTIISPNRWQDGLEFLLYRRLENPAPATTVIVGYNPDLTARLFPASGPFNLFSRMDPGVGRGQLNSPRGVALSPDGRTIYVVDSLNARVQRYGPEGDFIGAWGGPDSASGVTFGLFSPSGVAVFGPTGIAVGPEGAIYIADTWNHRVVVMSPDGTLVREIGMPPERTDIGDDPADVGNQPGRFYGPRAIAIANDEVYVVDTGNERVQVFGLDGSFRRVWGGFGTGPQHLIEPVGIAVGPDGAVYVADSGNGRISVFSPDGQPLEQWPIEEWAPFTFAMTDAPPSYEPYLDFGPDGLLYVSSRVTGSVLVLGSGGEIVNRITSAGNTTLVGPVGVRFGPDNTLYISDPDQNAVLPLVISVIPDEEPEDLELVPATPIADEATPDAATPMLGDATPDVADPNEVTPELDDAPVSLPPPPGVLTPTQDGETT